VSANQDPEERLRRIEQILASSATDGSRARGADRDVLEVLLASVMTDRINQTIAELERGAKVDAVDTVAMRLLLTDYAAAVACLRTVARTTEQRLDDLADAIRGGNRIVDHAQSRERKGGGA